MNPVNSTSQRWLPLLALLLVAACQPAAQFESTDTTVMSRGVAVPVTFVHPAAGDGEAVPLVVMVHGHGGSRHEAGGFTGVAGALAARGIASIRMDFPGCGDSTESFANNNLGNMLADIAAARDFALARPGIDAERIGMLGFSMGGRLALMTAAADDAYKVLVTWAPAASNGADSMIEFVGGPEAWAAMKAQADDEGFAPFTTQWGQHQQLGPGFFTDLESSRPLDAAGTIEAPLLVLYGDRDEVVLPAVSEALIAAATRSSEVRRHVIEGADHGLGIFSDEPQFTEEAIEATVAFFRSRL